MEIEPFVVELEYNEGFSKINWCLNKFGLDCKIDYIYYTNVIPERVKFSFKNKEDYVLFKMTWG